jgi:hypothetical protein
VSGSRSKRLCSIARQILRPVILSKRESRVSGMNARRRTPKLWLLAMPFQGVLSTLHRENASVPHFTLRTFSGSFDCVLVSLRGLGLAQDDR